jgi:hypothetical protein
MRMVAWAVGLCFGVGLAALSVVAAGVGHGCYVLLGLVSAPLGLLGIAPAVLVTPLFWLFAGLLAVRAAEKKVALAFLLLMGAHLTGAVVALSVGPYADWMYLSRTATVTVTGALVYAVAQC